MGLALAGLEAVIFVILRWNVSSKCFFFLVFVPLWTLFLVVGLSFGLDESQLQLIYLIIPFLYLILKQDYLTIESLNLSHVLG